MFATTDYYRPANPLLQPCGRGAAPVLTAGSGHLAGGLVAVLSTRIMTSHGPAGWCSHWRACFKAAWMRSIIPCWEYYGRLKKSRKCQLQWAHRQPWIRIASVYVCMVIYRDILGSCAATSGGIATLALTTGGACVSLLLYSWDQTQGKVDIKRRKPLGPACVIHSSWVFLTNCPVPVP